MDDDFEPLAYCGECGMTHAGDCLIYTNAIGPSEAAMLEDALLAVNLPESGNRTEHFRRAQLLTMLAAICRSERYWTVTAGDLLDAATPAVSALLNATEGTR